MPKIKYAKQRNGEIFYPRTCADAVRFKDGESLETKINRDSTQNFPIASELEAREGFSNEVLMTPLRTLQLLEENGAGSGGGGGGGITIPVISSTYDNTSVDTGTNISIPFTFYSPNLGKGTLHLLVNGVEVSNKAVAQGSSYADFGVLEKGNYRLGIFVVDRGGIYTETLNFNLKVGALDISSTFDDSVDFMVTEVIKIPVTVDTISLDPVYATYTIDKSSTRVSLKSGYNVIQLPILSPGAHKVTITAESGVYKSNTLTFDVVIEDSESLVIISDFDLKESTYRNLVEFQYRVSLKGVTKFIAKYYDNGNLIKTLNIPSGTNIWSTRELEEGAHTLKIEVSTEDGSKSAEITRELTITPSSYKPMESILDASLVAWFDATGKTNNDKDKEVWTDKSQAQEHPTVDLYNVNFNTNGWIDNALKLNGGAYAVINLQPFKNITRTGLTIDIKYKTRDVGHQDACVLDIRDLGTSRKGVAVDTERMYLNSSTTKINSDVVQEEVSRATFVIDKVNSIAKIYNNAVLTETFLMTSSEDFSNTQNIYLGTKLVSVNGVPTPSVFGDCEIYSIRVYERALESDEIVQNYISDIVDLSEQQEIYELNYQNNIPTMYFYGDTSSMTKESKVPLRIKYISTDPQKYGESFDLVDCPVSWQGTSSLQYAVKNYKIKLKRQDGTSYKYTPFKDGAEESTFCLKADYMESSHANNTGMAKFINDQLYDTPTPPQVNNSKVRTTINGFPIQLYIAKDENVEPTYMGVFNFNLDKSCFKSLGLNNLEEGFENCARFEVSSNSDTSAGAFRNDTDESIREDFELSYPDEDDLTPEQVNSYYDNLKKLVSWVKNCDEATFKLELEQHFNKEYLIRYFLQVHTFGMIDNLGKNMMLATWDGNIWYPLFYDLDSQLGLDNTGYKKFMSDIDIVEGVYNTSNSKLFTMLQTCFMDDIKETYKTLRRTGKYSLPTILSYWYGEQVSKIGALQYNKDMEAKYIAFKNDYLFMLHGRRYEHLKKWMSERLLYLDTIYGYEEDTSASITIRVNTLNTIRLNILTYSPQYLKVRWRNGIEQVLKIGRNSSGDMTPTTFSGTVATATDQEVIIYNAKQIKSIEGLASANPSTLNLVEASRLVSVDCQNSKVLTDIRLSSNNKFLNYLNLNKCSALGDSTKGGSSTLDLSYLPLLQYVNVNETQLTNVILPTTGCNLEELYVFVDSLSSLVLKNMPILKTLRISAKSIFSDFVIENCPELKINNSGTINRNGNVYNTCEFSAENLSIRNCNKIFNNIHMLGIGTNTVNNPEMKSLIFDNCGDYKLPIIKIKACREETVVPHLSSFKMNCNIGQLMMLGIGLVDKQPLDINCSKIDCLMIKKFTNISELRLTKNLEGLYLGSSKIVEGDMLNWAAGTWIGLGNTSSSSKEIADYTDFSRIGTIYNGETNVTDTFDFSNNPKMSVLTLDEKVLPDTLIKVIVNCDFTLYKYSDFTLLNGGEYGQWQFYIPINCEVEGYIKSSKYTRSWYQMGTSSTVNTSDSKYPLFRNFEKLDWDFSEITDCCYLFSNCRNLEILPDSLTPEVFNRGKVHYAFNKCTSLTDLNKLEGMNINLYISDAYNVGDNAFREVKGPFTIGNITVNSPASNYNIANFFQNSGVTSVGNLDINMYQPQLNGMFNNCSNLETIGDINVKGVRDNVKPNCTSLFENCTSLHTVGHLNIQEGSTLTSMFRGCTSIETWENISISNSCHMESTFSGSNLNLISRLPNYEEVIRTASNLVMCFNNTQITEVPDLNITSAINATSIFGACSQLVQVGNIVVDGTTICESLFRNCKKLKTINKLDLSKSKDIIFLFISDNQLSNIDYLDISSFTHDASSSQAYQTNSQLGNGTGSITYIGFKGTLGKYFAYTNIASVNPLNLASITSMIECLETLASPQTLKIHRTSFALLTEELISKATAKNWTLVSA